KALVGLRPHEPSRRLIDFALDQCPELPPQRAVGDLLIPPERLGATVAVFELEAAVAAGDPAAAREQLGRLLLVSDHKPFTFDILLDLAAHQPDQAMALVPLVHYCLRAARFVGPGNMADFLLPALDALVMAKPKLQRVPPEHPFTSVWEALPHLVEAPMETLTLAAHGVQIAADEHVKQAHIQGGILRALSGSSSGSGSNKKGGSSSSSGSRKNKSGGGAGDRGWLLDVLEQAVEITPQLLLWADTFRMLYRTAGEEHYGLIRELAEARLGEL
ncbi:MAG: hypothetical protein V3W14_00870, partial [Candidatus Neomarinimicrobiota bacterium]